MKKAFITIGAFFLVFSLFATEPVKSGIKAKKEKKEQVSKIIKMDKNAIKTTQVQSKKEKSGTINQVKQISATNSSKKN